AECARTLNRHPPLAEVNSIVPIQSHANSMFKDSIDAFVREDVELARAVVSRDKQLDDMNASANRQLTERMMQDRDHLRGYLNLILISRCLERVGDHATNIAEAAVRGEHLAIDPGAIGAGKEKETDAATFRPQTSAGARLSRSVS